MYKKNKVIILDYGSQYTRLIARRLRELNYYSEVHAHDWRPESTEEIRAVILSGGPDSTQGEGARGLPSWVLESTKPILGICYGMQLLNKAFGGQVLTGTHREYGKAIIHCESVDKILLWKNVAQENQVWMSHGDSCSVDQNAFHVIAKSSSGVTAAIAHQTLPYFGIQFHPEVHQSEYGVEILKNFLTQIAKIDGDWQGANVLETCQQALLEAVGPESKVLMAVSGGVDSSIAYALMQQTLGASRVIGVMVDHGLLRHNEADLVVESFEKAGLKAPLVVNARKLFFNKLKGVVDPEEKRKIIGGTFIEVFDDFALKDEKITHLGQGTLYSDVIESAGAGSGAKVIKSHHNVGGLPEHMKLKLVEPLRLLFKDEVRELGYQIGLAKELIERHPFPGPGLGIRVLGEVTEEKVRILQKVDHVFISELHEHGLYHKAWQAFAVLLPVKSVGVMGDGRTYAWTAVLRAVSSTDGMTAQITELPLDFLSNVARKIVGDVEEVNRVCFDITSKPPGTIEWE